MQDVLSRVFGHAALRGQQRPAVEAFLQGRDVVVVMPTGAGKSLCFQLPAVVRARAAPGVTLVVSPLVALMEDQVAALRARGVPAACLHSAQDELDQYRTEADFLTGRITLLYVSPERLGAPSFLRHLDRAPIHAVVVDEAHCVSTWGHDFRPDFRAIAPRIASLREKHAIPVMALTASATPAVIDDVRATLQLRSPVVIRGGFARPNLEFSVEHVHGTAARDARLAEILQPFRTGRPPGRAIVYTATRKRAESATEHLVSHGFPAACYHAGRTDEAREKAQRAFAVGRTPVLVATNAFGMGVDRPDVRVVVHLEAPGSVEAYYQEAGRAGRDGDPAQCILFFGTADVVTQRVLQRKGRVTAALMDAREHALARLQAYATSSDICRAARLVAHFEDVPPDTLTACGHCDVCRGTVAAAVDPRPPRTPPVAAEPLRDDDMATVLAAAQALRKPVGKAQLARALRGSTAADVRRKGLMKNPHHGALAHCSETSILAALDALLADGRLEKKGVKYPTVWPAGKGVRTPGATGGRPRTSGLLGALKTWRKRTARALGWKPYMVAPNAALQEMAELRPFTHAELLAIRGMGPARLERFGTELLVLIAQHAGR